MPGMYPQVLSLCTRNDIEMMILQPRDEFGKNSDLVWEMLSHYIRMPQPGKTNIFKLFKFLNFLSFLNAAAW